MDYITKDTKTFQNTTKIAPIREENKVVEEPKEENYEKISIMDLLGDDF